LTTQTALSTSNHFRSPYKIDYVQTPRKSWDTVNA
jgi:hypothetical protein